MANVVSFTVKGTDATGDLWARVRAEAAKAGASAADSFNEAFRLRASASAGGVSRDRLETTGGIAGDDKALLNKLKSYADTPGGIGILGTGNDTSLMSMLRNSIRQQAESGSIGLLEAGGGGSMTTDDIIKQVIAGNSPSNVTTEDVIRQVIEGNGPSNVTTDDLIRQVFTNNVTGNVSTEDFIRQVMEGQGPHNTSTTNVVHEKVDASGVDGKKDGGSYGTDFLAAFNGVLKGKGGEGGGGGGGGIAEGLSSALNSGGIAGGALPGVAGISGMAATVTGLAGALVAVLPALTSVLGGLTAIGGGFAILEETDKSFAADMKSTMGDIEKVFESAAAPLAAPLESAARQIGGYFQQIEPLLKSVFGDSAKLVQPLVYGFEGLTGSLLPGFTAMIKAAAPVFQAFAGSLGTLGGDLGAMFRDFSSDGAGSAAILSSLVGLVGSLLPFLGDLGKILVSAVAPAVAAFSKSFQQVLPALTPLLSVLGSLAGAVLGDLASVLGSVGSLLVGLSPSFKILASVASSLFNTLENTGVFAILGNSLESLAGPLAGLVNTLVQGLAPSLPGIIGLVSQWSGILASLAADGLGAVLSALTKVVSALSPLLPLVTGAYIAFKAWGAVTMVFAALPAVIGAVTTAFTAMSGALDADTILLKLMYAQDYLLAAGETAVAIATGAWTAAQTALDVASGVFEGILDTLGIGEVLALIGLLLLAIIELIKHWKQVADATVDAWNAIYAAVSDAVGWIVSLFSDGGIERAWNSTWKAVSDFTDSVMSDITGVFSDAWKVIENGVLDFATISLEAYRDVVSAFLSLVGTIINGAADAFGWIPGVGGQLQGAARAFDNMKNHVSDSFNAMIGAVQGFQANIDGLHGKSVDVDVYGVGSGGVKVNGPTTSSYVSLSDYFDTKATGGLLPGFGGGDIVPTLLEPGEAVVDKNTTRRFAGLLGAMGVPGMSSGGVAGWGGMVGSAYGNALVDPLAAGITAALAGVVKAISSDAAPQAGPGGGTPAANARLAQALYPAYSSGPVWSAWNSVAMRESGWDQFARNPSSGAYGIPQALPESKLPFAGQSGGGSNPTAQITWMWDYMAQRWGGPIGAWQNELSEGWYDHGGWLPPGRSIALNTTGRPEPVGWGDGGAASCPPLMITLELGDSFRQAGLTEQQLKDIRYTVRALGGKGNPNNVQKAFGSF